MSHFAKIEDGIVTQILVAEQDFIDTQPGTWVQTSYNTRGGVHYAGGTDTPDDGTPLRKNYAGIGYHYDSEKDAFYSPKPHESWVLDENTFLWNAPIPLPDDEKLYVWEEYDDPNKDGEWVEWTE